MGKRSIIQHLQGLVTWKRLLAGVGLFGLLYMLFVPSSRDPMLIIVFFTLLGIGPLASADQRSNDGSSSDSGERRRAEDDG